MLFVKRKSCLTNLLEFFCLQGMRKKGGAKHSIKSESHILINLQKAKPFTKIYKLCLPTHSF